MSIDEENYYFFKYVGTVLNAAKRSWTRILSNKEGAEPFQNGPDLHVYRFSDIKAATDEFSLQNKIGQGGYGPVYKVGKMMFLWSAFSDEDPNNVVLSGHPT